MPIPGIQQPEVLHVPCQDHIKLRLRKYDGHFDFAWPWYQDPETVRLVDGKTDPYTPERLLKSESERKRGDIRRQVDGKDRYFFYISTHEEEEAVDESEPPFPA